MKFTFDVSNSKSGKNDTKVAALKNNYSKLPEGSVSSRNNAVTVKLPYVLEMNLSSCVGCVSTANTRPRHRWLTAAQNARNARCRSSL